jgi:hypothetical protein
LGVTMALGTDWLPTGSMNLLRELACADTLNQNYYAHYFTDRALFEMVTSNAARLAGVSDVIGQLAPGTFADITVFDGSVHPSYRAVIDAHAPDVALVLRGGTPLYGDANIVAALANDCDDLDVCGVSKRVCASSEIGESYATLRDSVASHTYPAFYCDTPVNEPTCTPLRTVSVAGSTVYTGIPSDDDSDGDGIPNDADDCALVFNPVRPLDLGVQADTDGDGVGDACDVCPLEPNTDDCVVLPLDTDADGVLDAQDDCPTLPNADQLDTDHDGIGDACDACPTFANSAGICAVSVYDVKQMVVPRGQTVIVQDALVSAVRAGDGFFLQVAPGDPGYDGPSYSGIFVFSADSTNQPVSGDRVDLTGTVTDFFGEVELTLSNLTVKSSGEALPLPVEVLPSDVATEGNQSIPLDGALIEIANVAVQSADAAAGEYVVESNLVVGDLLFATVPFPGVGDRFQSITGILLTQGNVSKLEPRSSADLVR